jgi:hypothetical protein
MYGKVARATLVQHTYTFISLPLFFVKWRITLTPYRLHIRAYEKRSCMFVGPRGYFGVDALIMRELVASITNKKKHLELVTG